MKYLPGVSYDDLLDTIPWQILQQIISVIPPTDTKESDVKKEDNKSMDFFDFGKKMLNLR